jgi:predicted phage terminase large subunit-like protein
MRKVRDGNETPEAWLTDNFPDIAHSPMAPRHQRLWKWFDSLGGSVLGRPRVEVWPRGGAKSATAELACAFLATRLTRRFVLYVCETQAQADLHVQTIGAHLERLGVVRAVSKYGVSRGWRKSELRTRDGFHVIGYGLDAASRGIKVGQFRPDVIIFDDIDSPRDSAAVLRNKLEGITTSILPAGSRECAVLFIQNLVHEDSVVAQLVDRRAQFLFNREVPTPDPAVLGLVTDIVQNDQGANVYAIKSGIATWEGQPLSACERQINDWGLRAFLREAQHEVQAANGYFFDTSKFEIVEATPKLVRVCLAWDLAATEGGGDHTAAVLLGKAENGQVYVLLVVRGQYSSERVREMVKSYAGYARHHFGDLVTIRLPQDPGQAGKAQADQLRRLLAGHNVIIRPATGPKPVRARGYGEQVNLGNVKLLKADWNSKYIEEHRKFQEDLSHEFDDQIDAASDAFNELFTPTAGQVFRRVNPNETYMRQRNRSSSALEEEEDED